MSEYTIQETMKQMANTINTVYATKAELNSIEIPDVEIDESEFDVLLQQYNFALSKTPLFNFNYDFENQSRTFSIIPENLKYNSLIAGNKVYFKINEEYYQAVTEILTEQQINRIKSLENEGLEIIQGTSILEDDQNEVARKFEPTPEQIANTYYTENDHFLELILINDVENGNTIGILLKYNDILEEWTLIF